MYLCYDIKGIQRFIFSVPKLKCVVGASALIDQFDLDAKARAQRAGVAWIFSGGGRGAFTCSDTVTAERFERQLVAAAHEIGVDIRIGLEASLPKAAVASTDASCFAYQGADAGGAAGHRQRPGVARAD